MRRLLMMSLIAAAAVLGACTVPADGQPPGTVSTPSVALPADPVQKTLEATLIDEQSIVFAYQSLEAVSYSIDALIEAKVITPGSPRANQLADALVATLRAIEAVSALQKAGQSRDALTKWHEAKAGLASLRALLKPGAVQ